MGLRRVPLGAEMAVTIRIWQWVLRSSSDSNLTCNAKRFSKLEWILEVLFANRHYKAINSSDPGTAIANVLAGTLLDIRLTREHSSGLISNLQQQEKIRLYRYTFVEVGIIVALVKWCGCQRLTAAFDPTSGHAFGHGKKSKDRLIHG